MNFMDFKKKLVSDEEFAKKYAGFKSAAELIEAAAADGFTFTEDDLKNNTDLLPEELEKSAGGLSFVVTVPIIASIIEYSF